MTRKPDRDGIPGYPRTTWAEWDWGNGNNFQNVTWRAETTTTDETITIKEDKERQSKSA